MSLWAWLLERSEVPEGIPYQKRALDTNQREPKRPGGSRFPVTVGATTYSENDDPAAPGSMTYQKRIDDLSPHALPSVVKNDSETLARWGCHKVVSAGKIMSVGELEADELRVEGTDGKIVSFKPAPNMFARMRPIPGDYYVVYDDGYASISPRKAFEEGYHRL